MTYSLFQVQILAVYQEDLPRINGVTRIPARNMMRDDNEKYHYVAENKINGDELSAKTIECRYYVSESSFNIINVILEHCGINPVHETYFPFASATQYEYHLSYSRVTRHHD